jgi:hypothetical protein
MNTMSMMRDREGRKPHLRGFDGGELGRACCVRRGWQWYGAAYWRISWRQRSRNRMRARERSNYSQTCNNSKKSKQMIIKRGRLRARGGVGESNIAREWWNTESWGRRLELEKMNFVWKIVAPKLLPNFFFTKMTSFIYIPATR